MRSRNTRPTCASSRLSHEVQKQSTVSKGNQPCTIRKSAVISLSKSARARCALFLASNCARPAAALRDFRPVAESLKRRKQRPRVRCCESEVAEKADRGLEAERFLPPALREELARGPLGLQTSEETPRPLGEKAGVAVETRRRASLSTKTPLQDWCKNTGRRHRWNCARRCGLDLRELRQSSTYHTI